jgi:hypothetical protein
LLIDLQVKQFHALNEWFKSPLGLSVAHEFVNQLLLEPYYLKGQNLLQLGNCGDNLWLPHLHYKHQWIANPFPIKNAQLECSLNQIPFARNSLDCVLAPLTLELMGNGLSVIDEIDRILKPMGHIILLSVNPWSLWGVAMKHDLLHCSTEHKVRMRTAFNINRTFLQRGYRQCALTNFYYIPPINSPSVIRKLSFFNQIGKMIWPFPSGFYCYIAQKYDYISPSLLRVEERKYNPTLQPAIN